MLHHFMFTFPRLYSAPRAPSALPSAPMSALANLPNTAPVFDLLDSSATNLQDHHPSLVASDDLLRLYIPPIVAPPPLAVRLTDPTSILRAETDHVNTKLPLFHGDQDKFHEWQTSVCTLIPQSWLHYIVTCLITNRVDDECACISKAIWSALQAALKDDTADILVGRDLPSGGGIELFQYPCKLVYPCVALALHRMNVSLGPR